MLHNFPESNALWFIKTYLSSVTLRLQYKDYILLDNNRVNRNTDLPFVSIVIPIYNATPTLSICLESIHNINYPKELLEVIVVDNGSTDHSPLIAKQFDVNVFTETSMQSSYAARNKGIQESRGDLIAFTDSDCIVTRDWLKHLVKEWENKAMGCFAGEIKAYQPKTLVEKFSDRELILRQNEALSFPYLPYVQTANAAFRRDVFDKIGLFSPQMVSGGDVDMSWRMQKELGLKIKFIPEALVFHKHRTNIKGLFKQFYKYERGEMLWEKAYKDYAFASTKMRWEELLKNLFWAIITFPANLKKYNKKQIDIVDLTAPFLRAVTILGRIFARMHHMKFS